MMDQNTAKDGIFVVFFWVKASTPRAVAQLSYRIGTLVLPSVFLTYTYKIKYDPELILKVSTDKDKVILDWTQEMEKHIEYIIRKNPEPWMRDHHRWKARPK